MSPQSIQELPPPSSPFTMPPTVLRHRASCMALSDFPVAWFVPLSLALVFPGNWKLSLEAGPVQVNRLAGRLHGAPPWAMSREGTRTGMSACPTIRTLSPTVGHEVDSPFQFGSHPCVTLWHHGSTLVPPAFHLMSFEPIPAWIRDLIGGGRMITFKLLLLFFSVYQLAFSEELSSSSKIWGWFQIFLKEVGETPSSLSSHFQSEESER